MKHSFFLISIFLFCIVSSDAGNRPEATKEDSIDAFTLTQWCALRQLGHDAHITSTQDFLVQAQSQNWFKKAFKAIFFLLKINATTIRICLFPLHYVDRCLSDCLFGLAE